MSLKNASMQQFNNTTQELKATLFKNQILKRMKNGFSNAKGSEFSIFIGALSAELTIIWIAEAAAAVKCQISWSRETNWNEGKI